MNISVNDLTIEILKELSFEELMDLYKSLPSADFKEMDGEYNSAMVGFSSENKKKISLWWLYDTEKGYWLGKAFTPSPNNLEPSGEGYNRWKIEGKEVHHMRFLTDMPESLIDGKITFRLKYASFKNDGGIVDMTDEVRRIRKDFYLCAGMADPEKIPPDFFCLSGPVNEYDHSSEWVYGDEVSKQVKIRKTRRKTN